MGNALSCWVAALPDALTSALFFTAWVAPSVLGPEWVKNLMLTMLIEFIVMHSSAFWIEHLQTVIVFGALYFAAPAWFKYYVAAKASATRQ